MLKRLLNISLTQWILVAMVVGLIVGWLFPESSQHLQIFSNTFIRLIKSIVAPLVFSTLVLGIAGHGSDLKGVGRLAVKSIIYFELATTLALFIGLAGVNIVRPGDGVSLPASSAAGNDLPANAMSLERTIEHLVPSSFVEAAARNEMLQVVFYAVIFAIALTQVRGKAKQTVLDLCEGVAAVMFKFTGIVMKFAPLGIAAAMAYVVGHSGAGVLVNLAKVMLTFYGALAVFFLSVLLPIMWIARIPVRRFVLAVREPAIIAFSTCSSEAALPDAMEQMRRFGISNRIVSFVLPTGYSFNLDGSTLYLAVGSIFVAQAANVELSFGQQLLMMLTLMLTSKGVAGMARSSIVVLSGAMVGFGLPLEGVAVLLGVDQLMDMGRAGSNLIGNCLASAVIARWEGELTESPGLAGHDDAAVAESATAPLAAEIPPEASDGEPRHVKLDG